jgi:hypothetical protein
VDRVHKELLVHKVRQVIRELKEDKVSKVLKEDKVLKVL